MAEAASRISTPQIPKLMGADVGVDIESKEDLEKAIGILAGFLTKDRLSRMQHVLDQRTASATVVFENPSNPNNVRKFCVCLINKVYDMAYLLQVFEVKLIALLVALPTLPAHGCRIQEDVLLRLMRYYSRSKWGYRIYYEFA